MKRAISLILVLVFCLSLCGCGKSKAAKEAEAAIEAIGEVTIDSGETIKTAEKLYNILTDAEKADVDNRLVLVDAQEKYAELQSKVTYENAKKAYEALNEVAAMCVSGMDAVYGGWYYGVYESNAKYGVTFYALSLDVPGFSSSEIEDAAKVIGMKESSLKGKWQNCLEVVLAAIALRGDYTTIEEKMLAAENILQELTSTYDDYTYYPKLKSYYSAVSSYVEFFTNPTGSFNQLADTVKEFENAIRTYEADVSFLFTK